MSSAKPDTLPPQHQEDQPGHEHEMRPEPTYITDDYQGSGKLGGKVALITGGDSGIGRAVAVHFAREGADVAVVYLDEDEDAEKTKRLIEKEGRRALLIAGDVGEKAFCQSAVEKTVSELGRLDVLVNNAAIQVMQKDVRGISEEQLERTFRTNIFAHFFLTQAALDHLEEGSAIINTCSVVAFQGNPTLLDYSSTKGAIVAFTRSLATNLAEEGIRVNSVAPGPIWTPLIPASFPADKVAEFGQDTPLGRAGQPAEVAPAYVFLASQDGAYVTGQTIHVNGGKVVGA